MSPADPADAYGQIVLVADMLAPHGRNPKDRPCVVVTRPGDARAGHQVVVAISTPARPVARRLRPAPLGSVESSQDRPQQEERGDRAMNRGHRG